MENLKQLKTEIIKEILSLDRSGGGICTYQKEDLLRLLKKANINLEPKFFIQKKYSFAEEIFTSKYYSRWRYLQDLKKNGSIIGHGLIKNYL